MFSELVYVTKLVFHFNLQFQSIYITTDPIVMKFCIVIVCTLRKVYNQVTK
jgi:hypothetical protein